MPRFHQRHGPRPVVSRPATKPAQRPPAAAVHPPSARYELILDPADQWMLYDPVLDQPFYLTDLPATHAPIPRAIDPAPGIAPHPRAPARRR